MFDTLPFERQKELLKTFIEKVVIDPEWFEIHYALPSAWRDHLLFESGGDDGNGTGGNGNGNGRKRGAHTA